MKGEATVGEYKLAYDFNALCLAEDHAGPMGQAMQNMGAGSMKTVRALFWAGAQKFHPEMTLEEAGLIIQEIGYDDAAEAVGRGVESAFEKAPKTKGKPKAARS